MSPINDRVIWGKGGVPYRSISQVKKGREHQPINKVVGEKGGGEEKKKAFTFVGVKKNF